MNKIIALLLITSFTGLFGQDMTNANLQKQVREQADVIYDVSVNYCTFKKNDIKLICVTDSVANRMRIISPISKIEDLLVEQVLASLAANFHTALDVKYAISEGVMWSVFIHPLKELSREQVENAIIQVYNANVNFGTTYQSTGLIFGGGSEEDSEDQPEIKQI